MQTREVAGGDLEEGAGTPLGVRLGLVGALLLVLAAAYVAVVVWLKTERARRRRHHAHDSSSRVRVAWAESVEELEVLGARPDPAETHEEFARRAGTRLPATGTALLDLAHDADAAAYAPDLLTDEVAERASSVSTSIAGEVRQLSRPVSRWRHRLDPRPLLPDLGASSRHRAESTRD